MLDKKESNLLTNGDQDSSSRFGTYCKGKSSCVAFGSSNRPFLWVSYSNSSESQDAIPDSLCSSPLHPRTLPAV